MINDWTYNGKIVQSIQEIEKSIGYKPFGFVYKLILYDKNGNIKFYYIGKKNLYNSRIKYCTQKELKEIPKSKLRRKKMKSGGFKYYQIIVSESNWKDYISSNDFIKKNYNRFVINREIMAFCKTDNELSYQEAKNIICMDALDDNMYLNSGVSIRRFGEKLIKI